MEPRHRRILKLLIEADDYVPLSMVADRLGCSERTVRNHLKAMDEMLRREYRLSLDRRPGRGVALVGEGQSRGGLLRDLFAQPDPRLGDLEKAVLSELLDPHGEITVGRLSERLRLSRSTVTGILDRVESWLSQMGLRLSRKPNVGVQVQGDERAKRLAISRLHRLLLSPGPRCGAVDPGGLLHQGELGFLLVKIREVLEGMGIALTEDALQGLAVHLAVAVKRVRQGCPIRVAPNEVSMVEDRRELTAARRIIERLEEGLCLRMPKDEAIYLALHIRSSRLLTKGDISASLDVSEEALRLSGFLIGEFASRLDSRLGSDERLLADLATHLTSSLNRIRCGFPVVNPILGQIKRAFFYAFEVGLECASKCEGRMGIRLPEDEVGYVVLHVQAALERLRGLNGGECKVVIFCPQGIGIMRLMEAKISSAFPGLRVKGAGSLKCLVEETKDPYSVVIGTSPPPGGLNCPYLEVTPLLKDGEIRRIEELIRKESQGGLSRSSRYPFILSLLREDLLLLNHSGRDRWEVIETMASILHRVGLVRGDYSEAVKAREMISSTCIGGGLAIPHGDPHMAVGNAASVACLMRPVDWGGEEVQVVIMIAGCPGDGQDLKRLFGELAALSEDGETLEKLKAAKSVQEFCSVLKGDLF
ncbi:transcriptional antiterminator [Thermanaerovibrio velox DSM 12556]|uniref:Transcriptional antiterminator n=1 Tax=Thermanaerovibrio velox DSM 12556 TaxID=926567 RepID=H0UN48_9BACT|nr:PRD domain-containing protein [Thermanaerovibrio velox]EHM09327.1 transcriptional antiterminator [Thermanaerovibrio velox DSM 12556]